jgi:hypothetical protein
VHVTTNDPLNRSFDLRINADVVPALVLSPEFLALQGTPKELKPIELTVTSSDGKPFDIVRIDADPKLAVTVRPASPASRSKHPRRTGQPTPAAAGGNRYVLTVAAKPDVPVGRAGVMGTLTTSHPRAPSLPIRVHLSVLGDLEVAPAQVALGLAAGTDTQRVKIRRREGGGLQVTGVESSDADFSATLIPTVIGREYDVVVRYAGKPERGTVRARLTVKTNDRNQGTIVIPLTGRP